MSQLIKSLKLHAYKEFMTVLCVRGGVLWSRFACYTSQESSEILFRAFKPILRVSWEQKCTECHSWAHLKSSLNSFVCVLLCDCYYYDYDDGKKIWHEVFQDNRSDTYDVRINEGDVTVKKSPEVISSTTNCVIFILSIFIHRKSSTSKKKHTHTHIINPSIQIT